MKELKLLMAALLSSTIALAACQKKEETPATGEAQPASQQQAQQPQQATETKQEVKEKVKQQTAKVDGEAIFKSKGCAAYHQPNADNVGPGLNKIASAYKGNKDGLVKYFNGEEKAIVDSAKEYVMKPYLEVTKKLSKDEKEALAEIILKYTNKNANYENYICRHNSKCRNYFAKEKISKILDFIPTLFR
jgi:cytochrome c551/c552